MKKTGWLIIISILFLAACSRDAGFELISAKADIVRDSRKTGTIVISNESTETELIPTSLYYEFELKNKGKTILSSDKFQIRIEPSSELNGEIHRIVGQNVISPNGLGGGWEIPSMPFKAKQNGTVNIFFHLGAYKDGSKIPTFPSDEQLIPIKEKALKADLVLLVENKEVARFDLK